MEKIEKGDVFRYISDEGDILVIVDEVITCGPEPRFLGRIIMSNIERHPRENIHSSWSPKHYAIGKHHYWKKAYKI